jgi:hypothetical protein
VPGKPGMTGRGLGGRREGAGRPCQKVSIKPAETFCVSQANAAGRQQGMSELWQVESVTRSVILFRNTETGDTIKLVR